MLPLSRVFALAALTALCASSAAQSADWLHWRGPNQNGHSLEKNLPDSFETQTKYAAGSAQVIGLKPRQSAVLTATLPGCFAQLDVYVGPEVDTPPHAPYKLLGAEHAGGPAFCNASSPATCT